MFLTCWMSCVRTTAPHSSKHEIDNLLIGATFVLDMTKETCTWSQESTRRRYTTPAYAFSETSLKPWICIETIILSLGKWQQGMAWVARSGSSALHLSYVCLMWSGTKSSQSRWSSHRRCRSIFMVMTVGENYPIISNTLATLETNALLEMDSKEVNSAMVRLNLSNEVFHSRPSVFM